SVLGLGRVMVLATTAFGVGLVAFSLSQTLWLSLLVLPLVGAGMMVTMASTNTIIQTVVREELRGRVMAFYTMAFLGTAPIGSLRPSSPPDPGTRRCLPTGSGAADSRWRRAGCRRGWRSGPPPAAREAPRRTGRWGGCRPTWAPRSPAHPAPPTRRPPRRGRT